jgi:sigma-B regulation protein RsbU (phosphoserine phosphatase)
MSQIEDLRRTLGIYKGLVEVSALINAITNFDELLAEIMEVARRVMCADASSIFLLDDEQNLRLAVARGPAGEITRANIIVPRGRGIAGWVLENRQPALVPDAYADERFYSEVDRKSGYRTRSIICVPLARNGHNIGVLQALNPTDKEAFDEADLEAFTAYATLAATAIDKLRSIEQQREQELVLQELAFAREIQNSFLPQSLPELPNLTFAASYRPAENIGGDFYDVLPVGGDEIYFVVGDVSGKGIPAALLMAQSLSLLRLIVVPGISPTAALTRWNDMLCGHTIRGMFITTLLGRIVPSERRLEIASAGHCAPFLVRGCAVNDLPITHSPPLGIMSPLAFAATETTLSPGEWVVGFTDGLTESFAPDGALFEREGVRKILQQHEPKTASDVIDTLRGGESAHRGHADPNDDLTLLVFGFR